MEAVARQFATGKKCLVIRNGWFSYRWTQIFDMGHIPAHAHRAEGAPVRAGRAGAVRAAADRRSRRRHPRRAAGGGVRAARRNRVRASSFPTTTCAPSRDAVHEVGGLFVLDCIASGAIWVDMKRHRRRRADQRAAKGLEQLALLRAGHADRARARARSTAPPAPASPATSRSGCRSWKPTRAAATPTTRRCPPTR